MLDLVIILSLAATPTPAEPEPTSRGFLADLGDSIPGKVLDVVNDAIPGTLTPKRVSFSAPSTVILDEMLLTDPEGQPVAKIEHLEADVALTPLFSGDLVIETLNVTGLLLLLKLEGGKLNIMRALVKEKKPGKKPPPNIEIRLEKVTVTDGAVRYTDGKTATVVADNISGRGRAEILVRQKQALVHVDEVKAKSGTVKLEKLDIPFGDVTGKLRLAGRTLFIESAQGRALNGPFNVGGKIIFKDDNPLKLNGSVRLKKGTWPERLDVPPFDPPRIKTTFKVTGPAKNPEVFLDGNFGPLIVEGYPLSGGHFQLTAFRDHLTLHATRAELEAGGAIEVGGDLVYESKALDLKAHVLGPTLATLTRNELDPAPLGRFDGDVTITGPYDRASPLAIDVTGVVRGGILYDTTLPKRLALTANLQVSKTLVRIFAAHAEGAQTVAEVVGTIGLQGQKNLDLEVAATVPRPRDLRKDIPKNIKLSDVAFQGKVSGPSAGPAVTGLVSVARGDAAGVPVAGVAAQLYADKNRVAVSALEGKAAEGLLSGRVELSLVAKKALGGEVQVDRLNLATLKTSDGEALPLTGRAYVTAQLSGTTDAPDVRGTLRGQEVTVQEEALGQVEALYLFSSPRLLLQDVQIQGPLLDAESNLITVDLDAETLRGQIQIPRVDVSKTAAKGDVAAAGEAKGRASLAGTFRRPDIQIWLDVEDLSAEETPLGAGPLHVTITGADDEDAGFLITAATRLRGGVARLRGRLAYTTENRQLHARVDLKDAELAPWLARGPEGLPTVLSSLSGEGLVRGPVDDLDVFVHLETPSMTVAPVEPTARVGDNGRAFADEVRQYKTYGAVTFDAELIDGDLEGTLCAFPDAAHVEDFSPCTGGQRLWAALSGTFDMGPNTFDLDVEAFASEERFQQFVPALAAAELALGGELMSNVDVRRDEAGEVYVDGLAHIESLRLLAPGAPAVSLSEPASLRISESDARLEAPAHFAVGPRTVAVAGHVDFIEEQLGVSIQGEVALSLLRLFTDELKAASGTAETQLVIAGPLSAPRYDGCVRPARGAQVLPRSWGQRIVFESGALCLETARDVGGRHLFLARTFRAQTGEGRLFLDGEVEAAHVFDAEDVSIERWDLRAVGEELSIIDRRQLVRGGFDLRLVGEKEAPILKGNVSIVEGLVRESFELKNFVLEKEKSAPSEPLAEQLRVVSLENLLFDVDLNIENMRILANVSTLRLDADLRGDLLLSDSVRVPQLTGLLDVTEGAFIFPHATFEVEQTEIEFPRRPDGRLNPNIYVLARGDLEPPKNGLSTEVGCLLSVDGDLDRLTLKLETQDADHDYDQSTILRFVLFGTPLSSGQNFEDADAALRAASTELTAAFTRDLEETVQDQFGTQLSFDLFYEGGQVKGGVRYQLGERIKFEGETGVSVGATNNNTAAAGGSTSSGSNARLRLLLIDHFPTWWVGEDLAFQGEVRSGDTSGNNAASDLRLSYRVFEF